MVAPKSTQKSFWQKARWWASALFFPFPGSWRKLAVFAGTWFVLQPLSVMLFPRAEKVVEQEGLDPKIVQELAPGKKIYVRTDNIWGKTHLLFGSNPFEAGVSLAGLRNPTSGGFVLDKGVSPIRDLMGICSVYLKRSLFPDKALFRQALLHEVRHCSDENQKLARITREGDADYGSITALAREMEDPDLKEAFLLFSAISYVDAGEHDVALYLDALMHGKSPPAAEEILGANMLARLLYKEIDDNLSALDSEKKNPGYCKLKPEFQKSCSYDFRKEPLPPLALRRAELYHDGMKMYWEQIQQTKKPR